MYSHTYVSAGILRCRIRLFGVLAQVPFIQIEAVEGERSGVWPPALMMTLALEYTNHQVLKLKIKKGNM